MEWAVAVAVEAAEVAVLGNARTHGRVDSALTDLIGSDFS